MSRSRCVRRAALLGFVLVLVGSSGRADQVWSVSLDTSQLAMNYGGGPFGLDFELIGTNGNTVTLSNFSFGTGSASAGPAFLTGGAGGNLGSTVSLNDSADFFTDFNQQFTPGGSLNFAVDSTLVPPGPGGTPDNFSIVLFSSYDPVNGYDPFIGTGGTPIPTTDPTGSDTFFNLNINGPGATTASGYSGANGDLPITVTPAGTVPEPSSCVLLAIGLLSIARAVCRKHGSHPRTGTAEHNAGEQCLSASFDQRSV